MATRRNEYTFRGGDIIEREEYHDGKYGAKGKKREGLQISSVKRQMNLLKCITEKSGAFLQMRGKLRIIWEKKKVTLRK